MKIAGSDGFKVAGHKVSWTMVGALAAVIGAFLVWRFHQAGGLGAGTAPAAGGDTGASVYGQDYSGALANLSQQVSDIEGKLGSGSSSSSGINSSAGIGRGLFGSFPSFAQWISTPRPDIQKAVAQHRLGDLQGQYNKEFAAWVASSINDRTGSAITKTA